MSFQKVCDSRLRWYGHETRIYQERTVKKLLGSTPIGRRPRGRPRTRWRDYVEDLSSVVLKLGSTEPQGFGEAVAGVRLRSE